MKHIWWLLDGAGHFFSGYLTAYILLVNHNYWLFFLFVPFAIIERFIKDQL